MRIETTQGIIGISNQVLATVAGFAASSCFGVKGMTAISKKDGLFHLLKREAMSTGIVVHAHDENDVELDLHIAVNHGINVVAICRSIVSEVRYNVQRVTGVKVRLINIFVESIKA